MELLVLSPPVCTPAEPAAGAFTLAAGLAGRGLEVGLLDLSLEHFHRVFEDTEMAGPEIAPALQYLLEARGGYDAQRHRSAAGLLHARLRGFGKRWPGWSLTLMDLTVPGRVHDPRRIHATLRDEPSPFEGLWTEVLDPVLDRERPGQVIVSLAYLSQLASALDLVQHLLQRGLAPIVGGSLPNSLARTGSGLQSLRAFFPRLEVDDGLSLASRAPGEHLVDQLAWPRFVSPRPYLSARPVVPIPLSLGCHWNRCTFCPDRGLPVVQVPLEALDNLFATAPEAVRGARPLVHLLDSAVAPASLRRFLPIARKHGLQFYGFARPTRQLNKGGLLEDAAEAGCVMLQLGVEGGSHQVLERFDKGLNPEEAREVVVSAAAAGIRTYLYLLFGLPGEGPADRALTLDMLVSQADAIDFLNLSVFNLPHHSELTERSAEHGIELSAFPQDGAIRLYRPFRVRGIDSRKEARAFLDRELRRHPALRPILARTPRWLRAAHNAMMRLEGRR